MRVRSLLVLTVLFAFASCASVRSARCYDPAHSPPYSIVDGAFEGAHLPVQGVLAAPATVSWGLLKEQMRGWGELTRVSEERMWLEAESSQGYQRWAQIQSLGEDTSLVSFLQWEYGRYGGGLELLYELDAATGGRMHAMAREAFKSRD